MRSAPTPCGGAGDAGVRSRDVSSGAETCDSLSQAVVFAVALAIDPRVGLEADATTVRLAAPADGADGGRAAGAGGGAGADASGADGDGAGGHGDAAGAPGAGAGFPRPSVVAGVALSAGSLPDALAAGVAVGVRGSSFAGFLSWGLGAFAFGPRENDDVGASLAGAWVEVCAVGAFGDRVELRACPRFLGGGYTVYVVNEALTPASPAGSAPATREAAVDGPRADPLVRRPGRPARGPCARRGAAADAPPRRGRPRGHRREARGQPRPADGRARERLRRPGRGKRAGGGRAPGAGSRAGHVGGGRAQWIGASRGGAHGRAVRPRRRRQRRPRCARGRPHARRGG